VAKKITKNTCLKKGDIVRIYDGKALLGIVAKNEKSGSYAFSRSTDDRQFSKENKGIDLYQRKHINDLSHMDAEVISPIELVCMFENAECTLRTLQGEYVPYQNDTLENCQKKIGQLQAKIASYGKKMDDIKLRAKQLCVVVR
jgi:hypothetical protein